MSPASSTLQLSLRRAAHGTDTVTHSMNPANTCTGAPTHFRESLMAWGKREVLERTGGGGWRGKFSINYSIKNYHFHQESVIFTKLICEHECSGFFHSISMFPVFCLRYCRIIQTNFTEKKQCIQKEPTEHDSVYITLCQLRHKLEQLIS